MSGKIHLYTGNGKGKTTAAVGLAIRAYGAGRRVLFTQFVKGNEYHEIAVLKRHPDGIVFRNYGRECFFNRGIEEEDRSTARKGFEDLRKMILAEPAFDLIILDEITIAIYHQLLFMEDIRRLIQEKPVQTELVLTGRYAPQELIDLSDLVTEMTEVKHYYTTSNLLAREGIEF
jgi:cob(I)alamin adenosyltransferase